MTGGDPRTVVTGSPEVEDEMVEARGLTKRCGKEVAVHESRAHEWTARGTNGGLAAS